MKLEMQILKEQLQLTKFSSLDSFSFFFPPRSIPSGASVLGLVYHGTKIGRNIVLHSLSMSTRLSDSFCFLVVGSVNQRFTMENIHAENAELLEARSDEKPVSGRLPMIPIVDYVESAISV